MTSQQKTVAAHTTRAHLNRLIVACNDDRTAHDSASKIVKGQERRERLADSATRRGSFVDELGELVVSLGGTPAVGGSTIERVRAGLGAMRSLVIGTHAGDAYGVCARLEGTTEQLYERALLVALPDAARLVVARHHGQIADDRAELRRLAVGG